MPEIANVVGATPVASAWGNQIRDRVIQRYSTTAIRDSSVPSPGDGEPAWITGTDRLTIYDGTTWRTFLDTAGGQTISGTLTVSGQLSGKLRVNAGTTFAEFWARNIYFGSGATPTALQTGDVWFETNTAVHMWNGTTWVKVGDFA